MFFCIENFIVMIWKSHNYEIKSHNYEIKSHNYEINDSLQ